MAFGMEVALVLRAKGGLNFLTHTRGVGIKDSVEATQEVMEAMKGFRQSQGNRDADGHGNIAPGYASGQLLVCRGRLLVIYRLVNGVWVMTVTPAVANVLMCSQIIAATTRMLVAACRGVDVTPDKIARKYPEVYMAMGHVLGLGGFTLDSSAVLSAAEAEVQGIAPEGARQKAKGPAAAVKSRLGLGGLTRRGGMSSAPSSSTLGPGASPDPSFSARRRTDEASLMGRPFVLPPDALTPQATADPVIAAPRAGPTPSAPGDILDDLFGPPLPSPGGEFLAGTGLETLEAPAIDYGQFGDLSAQAPLAASDNPWSDFDTGLPPKTDTAPAPVAQKSKVVWPAPTSKQQRSIAGGNALQLVELWKALFVGGKLQMAGTTGEVLASGTVPRCAAHAVLQLQATPTPPEAEGGSAEVLRAVVESAHGMPDVTTTTAEHGIVAQFSEAPSSEAPFVRYSIPAMAVQPPILVAVSVSERHKPQASAPSAKPLPSVTPPLAADMPDGVSPSQPTSPDAEEARFGKVSAGDLPEGEVVIDESGGDGEESVLAGGDAASAQEAAATEVDETGRDEEESDPAEGAASAQEALPIQAAAHIADASAQGKSTAEKPSAGREKGGQSPTASSSAKAADGQAHLSNGRTEEHHAAAASEPQPKEHTIVISIAARPDLAGPLRGVCVDLDLHYSFGDVLSVYPMASFSSKQRRLRWNLYSLDPGSQIRLRVQCRQVRAEVPAIDVACARSLASVHAFGPPGEGLSGITLLSGADASDLRPSRMAFHCDVYARPEMPKQRGELTKKDMLAMALEMHERLKRSKEGEGEEVEEDQ